MITTRTFAIDLCSYVTDKIVDMHVWQPKAEQLYTMSVELDDVYEVIYLKAVTRNEEAGRYDTEVWRTNLIHLFVNTDLTGTNSQFVGGQLVLSTEVRRGDGLRGDAYGGHYDDMRLRTL